MCGFWESTDQPCVQKKNGGPDAQALPYLSQVNNMSAYLAYIRFFHIFHLSILVEATS